MGHLKFLEGQAQHLANTDKPDLIVILKVKINILPPWLGHLHHAYLACFVCNNDTPRSCDRRPSKDFKIFEISV